jgi:hypothetical protein
VSSVYFLLHVREIDGHELGTVVTVSHSLPAGSAVTCYTSDWQYDAQFGVVDRKVRHNISEETTVK